MTTGTDRPRRNGADLIAARLAAAGVRHVFGVGGANIEDVFLAVQRLRPRMMAILDKHEHSAGTAADAYARLSRSTGVVMTTSGGGAMNLVSALSESQASRVPVVAIVGEPPTALQGRGAFQDTSGIGGTVDAQSVLRTVSSWCERARTVDDVPLLVDAAVYAARERAAPAVVLVAKDLQQAAVTRDEVAAPPAPPSDALPAVDADALAAALRMLLSGPVAIIAGDEVMRSGAELELALVAEALDASVAVAPDARQAFDNESSRFVGVAGAMGHDRAAEAIERASVCLLVGTRLPILARQGLEPILGRRAIVAISREAPFVESRELVHLGGSLRSNLRALASILGAHRPVGTADGATSHPPADEVKAEPDQFGSQTVFGIINRSLSDDTVVIVDAGNTGAHAVHYLQAPGRGHWLVALGMAGMGYAFGASIGAAFATRRRCVAIAGDGAFFMHGLEIHTAVEHRLPITFVIFNNKAHGMCLIRERLLLGEESGYNTFQQAHIGAGLAAMFPGLSAWDCRSGDDFERAFARALTIDGPAVVGVELADVEVPPFAAFRAALAAKAASTAKDSSR